MVGTPDEPEWIAADACDVLGIAKPANVLRHFSHDEKSVCQIDTSGQRREMSTVTEAGLYRLIFKSRKPDAERLKSFVFKSVLPCLRKHGCYPEPECAVDTTALVQMDPVALVEHLGKTFHDAVFQNTEPLRQDLEGVKSDVADIKDQLQDIVPRKRITEPVRKVHITVVDRYYSGYCPCCNETLIVGENKNRLSTCEFDHWTLRSLSGLKHTWAVCGKCNSDLRDPDWKKQQTAFFEAYQRRRQQLERAMRGRALFPEMDE